MTEPDVPNEEEKRGKYRSSGNRDRTFTEFGWMYSNDSESIWKDERENKNGRRQLVGPDGGYYPRTLNDKKNANPDKLWYVLGPIYIGDLEISKNMKIWHEEREVYLKAQQMDIVERQPVILFEIVDSHPREYVEYMGYRMKYYVENGILKSEEQVHDELMESL